MQEITTAPGIWREEFQNLELQGADTQASEERGHLSGTQRYQRYTEASSRKPRRISSWSQEPLLMVH